MLYKRHNVNDSILTHVHTIVQLVLYRQTGRVIVT